MKTHSRLNLPASGLVAILVCAAWMGLVPKLNSQPTQTNSPPRQETKAVPPAKADPAQKPARRPPRTLSGAELYSIHCNRCHPERYPTERTAAQWKTILLHMRIRANLPAAHARLILQYLQENSGR